MADLISTPSIPNLVRTDPGNAVIISKLNADKANLQNSSKLNYLTQSIPDVAGDIRDRIKNNEDILQLFPDVELSIQILTSSILSPNDMMTTNLIYNLEDVNLPLDIKNLVLDIIKKYISKEYDLESKLSTILRNALFIKGSHILAIIPEAKLDNVVNNVNLSFEDFEKLANNKLNILGDNLKLSVSNEDFNLTKQTTNSEKTHISSDDLLLDISDNFISLHYNNYNIKNINTNINNKLNTFLNRSTSLSTEDKIEFNDLFKQNSNLKEEKIVFVNNTERKNIGKPLVMELNPESCIPVHVINNPIKHLGYFILLDENGIPINETSEILTSYNPNQTVSNNGKFELINKAANGLYGITKKDIKISELENIYNVLVDKMLKDKLKNGVYGDLAEIKENTDLYRVMLMRALKAKKTRMLFLPKELVSYFAFEYRENGTGKSMLEKVAMLFSLRSILLFSKVMATIKNSISITKVDAILDDNDIDPQKSIEKIISESLKTRQTQLPLGVMKINDLVDWSHKVGYRYNFKHPALPNMTIDVTNENSNNVIPDSELDTIIQKHIIMSFGLTPEIVESGYSTDFATTVMAKNLLFAKRVKVITNSFTPQVTEHIKKLLMHDEILTTKLKNLLKDNSSSIIAYVKKQLISNNSSDKKINSVLRKKDSLVEYMVGSIISNIFVDIASIETKEAQSMKESFDAYKTVVEEYVELLISSEALPVEIIGELNGKIDNIKTIIKSTLLKKWMTDNNYLPELSEFLTLNDDGKPIFNILDEFSTYSTNLSETILEFVKVNNKNILKYNNKLSKINNNENNDGDNEITNTDVNIDTSEENNGNDIDITDTDNGISDDITNNDSGTDSIDINNDTGTEPEDENEEIVNDLDIDNTEKDEDGEKADETLADEKADETLADENDDLVTSEIKEKK